MLTFPFYLIMKNECNIARSISDDHASCAVQTFYNNKCINNRKAMFELFGKFSL